MKKFFLITFFLLFPIISIAHPLDISSTSLSIIKKNVSATTYLHTFEVEFLLKEKGVEVSDIGDYFLNKNIFKKYFDENLIFKNFGEICEIDNFLILEDESYEILTNGLGFSYDFVCDEKIENVILENKLFINFPLQTNRVLIYDLNQNSDNFRKVIVKNVLTSKVFIKKFDLKNLKIQKSKDSDGDGISDEDEIIYGTDINNSDSDLDGYSDKEEVYFGWNPLDSELGPGQLFKGDIKIESIDELKNSDIFDSDMIDLDNIPKSENDFFKEGVEDGLGNFSYGNDFLKDVLKKIEEYLLKGEGSLFYLVLLVFVLGVLHALGPGHSKSLLVSYVLEKDKKVLHGFLFSSLFTVTHILDILVLFVIFHYGASFLGENFVYYTKIFSGIILFFLSIYLIFKFFKSKDEKNYTSGKKTLLIAFLSGLAPCSFAWSIFLLLNFIGKEAWIIPLIGALALGIFTSLFLISIIVIFLKGKLYSRIAVLGKYSSLLSAVILLFISIYLIF